MLGQGSPQIWTSSSFTLYKTTTHIDDNMQMQIILKCPVELCENLQKFAGFLTNDFLKDAASYLEAILAELSLGGHFWSFKCDSFLRMICFFDVF